MVVGKLPGEGAGMRFEDQPIIKYGRAQQSLKGEDFSQVQVFDGHNGPEAAKFCMLNLVSQVLEGIPPEVEGGQELIDALPRAMVLGFVKTDKAFRNVAVTSGTTATCVIIHGWTVTVGAVGDSSAYLQTASGMSQLLVSHRLEVNPGEVERIRSCGGDVSQDKSASGKAVGQLRVWPGGLSMSRAIGDFDIGDYVIPVPHVRQFKLAPPGGRLIIASDGVWDLLSSARVAKLASGAPPEEAAARIVQEAARMKGLLDDTTCLVVDLHSPGAGQGVAAPRARSKVLKSMGSLFGKKEARKGEEERERAAAALPEGVEELHNSDSPDLLERLWSSELSSRPGPTVICGVCMEEQPFHNQFPSLIASPVPPKAPPPGGPDDDAHRKQSVDARPADGSLPGGRLTLTLCASCEKLTTRTSKLV